MGNKYKEGDVLYVTDTVFIDGSAAFIRGENVRIERVEPNLEMPEYKYVVYSSRLRNYYFLRDQDLSKKPNAAAASQRKFSFNIFHSRTAWILTGSLALILIVTGAVLGYFLLFVSPGPEDVAVKYYEAIFNEDTEAFLSVVSLSEQAKSNPTFNGELETLFEEENESEYVSYELTFEVEENGDSATVTATSIDDVKSTLTMEKKDGEWLIKDSFGIQYVETGVYHTIFWDSFESLDNVMTIMDNADIDIDNRCESVLNGSIATIERTLIDISNTYIPVYQDVLNQMDSHRQVFSVVTPPKCPWYDTNVCRERFLLTVDGYGESVSERLNVLTYSLDPKNDDNYDKVMAHLEALDQKESSAVDYYNQAVESLNGILDARDAQLDLTF